MHVHPPPRFNGRRHAPRGLNKIDQERAALRQLARGESSASQGDVVPLIRRGTRGILLSLWVIGLLVAAVCGWLLLHHARTHTETTAISLEQFARRTITLGAFVVDEYGEFLDQHGDISGLASDTESSEKLGALVKWLPDGSNIGLVTPDGAYVTSTSASVVPPTVKALDRRWFQAITRDGLQTYVGPAILSRITQTYVFTYSSAYKAADGKLAAVISVGIPSGSITGLAPDQHHTNLALVQHEGLVVAALPLKPAMVGVPFALPGQPPALADTHYDRVFDAWSVVTVRNIPDLALYAVVAVPISDVLQPLGWGIGIGLPLLLLLTQVLLMLSSQLQTKSQQVEQALADNKVLFQEVHHRVKNNLQVISSLLRLQTERLPPELRPLLDETGARVRAIALVHEQIYRTASPSDVQLDRFMVQLVQQLSASMIGGLGKITTELQPMAIPLDRAVPVAILATEAITNAIKHGLDEGDGSIAVSLSRHDGRNVLTVTDSGKTVADQASATGLGTRIMTALARQIDGAWDLEATDGGTVFTLSWPA